MFSPRCLGEASCCRPVSLILRVKKIKKKRLKRPNGVDISPILLLQFRQQLQFVGAEVFRIGGGRTRRGRVDGGEGFVGGRVGADGRRRHGGERGSAGSAPAPRGFRGLTWKAESRTSTPLPLTPHLFLLTPRLQISLNPPSQF